MRTLLCLALLLGLAPAMSKLSPAALMDIEQSYRVVGNDSVWHPDSGMVTCDTVGSPGFYTHCRTYEVSITLPIDLGEDGKHWLTLVIPLTSPTGHDTVRVDRR